MDHGRYIIYDIYRRLVHGQRGVYHNMISYIQKRCISKRNKEQFNPCRQHGRVVRSPNKAGVDVLKVVGELDIQ